MLFADRRQFLRTGIAASAIPVIGHAAAGSVANIGSARQLFLDDALIDSDRTSGVSREINRPYRIRRVLKPDQPWEALGFIFYCSVVDDNGTAKLFHGSYDAEKKKHFALATSQDGIHWTRPNLGLKEYHGSRNNNLLLPHAVEASVFLDPNAPKEKRYRLIYSRHWPDPKTAGVYVASSSDGVRWTESDQRVLPFVPDSQHCGLWDPQLRKYVIYTRNWSPYRSICRVAVDDLDSPWPHDYSVPPHHVWGKHRVATLSHELPTVMARDDRDPAGVQPTPTPSCAIRTRRTPTFRSPPRTRLLRGRTGKIGHSMPTTAPLTFSSPPVGMACLGVVIGNHTSPPVTTMESTCVW